MANRPSVWGVFLLFACLYLLSLGRGFYSSDGEVMFKTTVALAERGTFALEPDPGLPQIVRGQAGRFYCKYDPGLPLIGIPFYVTGNWIGQVNRAHRYRLAATFYLMIPALSAAGALAALTVLARACYGGRAAAGAVLVAGLGTLLWPYARVLFAEATLACALTVTAALIVRGGVACYAQGRGGEVWLFAAGAAFGAGILVRAALAIYTLPLIFLIVAQPPARRVREITIRLIVFGAGMLPFGLILFWHNALRFGDPFQSGYGDESFTTPLWEGVFGLLFSPGKSVFLYAPPLVLSVLLWPRFRRAYPALGGFLALAWGVALAFYGTWWAWHGAWSWGPRLLVPLIPLSCLPLGMLPDRRVWRKLAGALIALGIGVQLLGVLTDVVPHYSEVMGSDESRYALVNFAPRHSPLVGAIRRVVRGRTEPLAMFHLADSGLPPTWTGGVPLLLSLGVVVGVRVIARRSRATRSG